MKAIIYTNHKNISWMKSQIPFIQREYAAIGDKISIDVVRVDVKPRVIQGSLDWDWFESTFKYSGYDCIAFDMSHKEMQDSGIKGAVAMYRLDPNVKHEFWMSHDKNRRYGRWSDLYPHLSEFTYLFLHEILHGEALFYKTVDLTHHKAADGTMLELFALYKTLSEKQSLLMSLLQKLAEFLRMKASK